MKLEQALLSIVRKAGQIMTQAQEIEAGGKVSEKGDAANLVTVYDVRVQEFLIQEIQAILPDAYFFAEEKENDPKDLLSAYCFIIDPIDGTANFVHDYRHSAVSVAMLSGGQPVFGAIYNPYQNEMFHAVKGGGAFLNDTPIHVSSRPMSHAIGAFGTSPYRKAECASGTFRLCEKIFTVCSDLRRCGTASLDLAYVAAGRCDFFFEYRLFPWDFAAGLLLVTEAGGIVTDMKGAPLAFDQATGIIAAPCHLHTELYDMIKEFEE